MRRSAVEEQNRQGEDNLKRKEDSIGSIKRERAKMYPEQAWCVRGSRVGILAVREEWKWHNEGRIRSQVVQWEEKGYPLSNPVDNRVFCNNGHAWQFVLQRFPPLHCHLLSD